MKGINLPSKEEKQRRKSLVKIVTEVDTTNIPISFQDLAELLDYLDEKVGDEGCDHTSSMTIDYLQSKSLNEEKILHWLGEYGGYCDCEILANVEDAWENELEQYT